MKRIPRLIAVQAANCAPLVEAFQAHRPDVSPIEKRETLAEGIAIAEPVRGRQILEALRETGGEVWGVTEEEIRGSLKEMGRKGYFIEPTSAATIAGLKKYLKHCKKDSVVSTLTGIGLKSTEKIGHLDRVAVTEGDHHDEIPRLRWQRHIGSGGGLFLPQRVSERSFILRVPGNRRGGLHQ